MALKQSRPPMKKTLKFQAKMQENQGFKSGETGIRTLGTLAGTPVFKTGAIGRSAISPGRMLLRSPGTVNAPVFEQTQSPTTGSVQIDFTRTDHEKKRKSWDFRFDSADRVLDPKITRHDVGLVRRLSEDKVGLTAQCFTDAFHDSFQMSSWQFGVNWQ